MITFNIITKFNPHWHLNVTVCPITHHKMGCHNIYLLIHGIFHQFFLYSYSKPSIILIYQGAAIWSYCVVLYTCCSTVSSASVHTLQKTHPKTRATMLVTQLFLLPQQVSHKEYNKQHW